MYYLLRYGLNRPDVEHPWIFDRCREVQFAPDGHLDLWAREHYKSTIITFALSIQDILASHGNDPLPDWEGTEVCIGIFSYTRPIAIQFLRQIKREFETNEKLLNLFPDVLYRNPKKESPKWSEYEGLVVRRNGNPKESTVEAWGIVDSQPTSKHFPIRVYDDLVTDSGTYTPEAILKTTKAWRASLDLGAKPQIARYIGTRWHHNDTYREMIENQSVTPRIHRITVDGDIDGEPVLKSREEVKEKRRDQGAYHFNAQQMQNPTGDSSLSFDEAWLKYYDELDIGALNLYLLCDPARVQKENADYTVLELWGYGEDENYYLVDGLRDRLTLSQRRRELIDMHRRYSAYGKVWTGYERTGAHADLESIREEQERETYRFDIEELGSSVPKRQRISALEPLFSEGRVYLPRAIKRTDAFGDDYDFIQRFIRDEYSVFPLPLHDDMLDCMAWIQTGQVDIKKPNRKPVNVAAIENASGPWM